MIKYTIKEITLFILLYVFLFSIQAQQSENIMVIQKLTSPIEFDGLSDEPAWESIPPLPVVMYQPIYGNNPSEKTEIRIAYNDKYLYISGRLYETDPSKIQVVSLERDGGGFGNDWVGIVLDTFDDNENAFMFFTTPAGNRFDAGVKNDSEGNSPINDNWNSFWDSKTITNEKGWFAEIRIPWSSLRFQRKGDQIKMGVIAWRFIARNNELIIFPNISPNWKLGFTKPSKAQNIIFNNIDNQRPLYITPHLLGGIIQSPTINENGNEYNFDTNQLKEIGLDVKYGITSNLTMDLTLNTDFAQAEADDPQVNLTRFSLFFPEKRQFFQERDDIFNFSLGGPTKLFYSRRIGLYDIGDNDFKQVPILGGLRITGRIAKWDVGFLNMQTAQTRFNKNDGVDSSITVPSENFGVVRVKRQVINPYSYIGGMFTSRISNTNNSNYNLGFDGSFKLFGDNYLIFAIAQTLDNNDESRSLLDANRFRIVSENRSNQGFTYSIQTGRRGEFFKSESGFEDAENYFVVGRHFSYAWFAHENSKVLRNKLSIEYLLFFDNANKNINTGVIEPFWLVERKDGSSYKLGIKSHIESLSDTMSLPGNVLILPKKYDFYELNAKYEKASGKLFGTNFELNTGSFYDGHYFSTEIAPQWNLAPHLTVGGSYQPTYAWFSNRDQSFNYYLLGLRIAYALNNKITARTFININSDNSNIGINFRFRYNPKEGTDLYFVYNEGINTDRNREIPSLPFTDTRSFFLKYSTTITPHLPWL